jgi:hypothetical protein
MGTKKGWDTDILAYIMSFWDFSGVPIRVGPLMSYMILHMISYICVFYDIINDISISYKQYIMTYITDDVVCLRALCHYMM